MIVVSDASPVICLGRIGRLPLLAGLYDEVALPNAVAEEVRAGDGGRLLLASMPFLVIHQVRDQAAVAAFLQSLDRGESEALVLARELEADVLLMDERRGRREAQAAGLHAVGTLGVLLAARERGLLPQLRQVLDEAIERGGLWVAPEIRARVLSAAGESAD